MALINCPECGKEISDTSKICVYCGYKLKRKRAVNKVLYKRVMLVFLCISFLIPMSFWGYNQIYKKSISQFKTKTANMMVIMGVGSVEIFDIFEKYNAIKTHYVSNNIYGYGEKVDEMYNEDKNLIILADIIDSKYKINDEMFKLKAPNIFYNKDIQRIKECCDSYIKVANSILEKDNGFGYIDYNTFIEDINNFNKKLEGLKSILK